MTSDPPSRTLASIPLPRAIRCEVLWAFPDDRFGHAGRAERAGSIESFGEVAGEVFGGGVAAGEGRVLIDVGVIELLRDRVESFFRRGEVDGELVALQLLDLENNLYLVGVAVQRLRPVFVVDQIMGGLETGRDGDAVGHELPAVSCQLKTVASRVIASPACASGGIARRASRTFLAVAVGPDAWSRLTSKQRRAPEDSASRVNARSAGMVSLQPLASASPARATCSGA